MKKQLISAALIMTLFLMLLIFYTGDPDEKIRLGYCPTMLEDAKILAEQENYELIGLETASVVLSALNNKSIDKGLIGRKAEQSERSVNTKERILESGYTLVSNNKGFIDHSQLSDYEIYTYVSKYIAENLIPDSSMMVYLSKDESIKKINEGKIVMISWDDWNDEYELIVVMDRNKKVKDFRGIFLYEN